MRHQVKKRWGQHFLADTNLLKKLSRIINPKSSDSILEIGPGGGALTEIISPQVKELIGVEIDENLYNKLRENTKLQHCTFINQDFLEIDLTTLPFKGDVIRVIGNIPYNITSPIIFKLLETPERWRDIHVMVQKEVADRLTASVGNRTYGRLTVMVQALMNVKYELTVPPEVFVPKPRVQSAVISLRPHKRFDIDSETFNVFREIVRSAFSQRRKMLKNSLREFGLGDGVELDLTRRPETLSVTEFLDLAHHLS